MDSSDGAPPSENADTPVPQGASEGTEQIQRQNVEQLEPQDGPGENQGELQDQIDEQEEPQDQPDEQLEQQEEPQQVRVGTEVASELKPVEEKEDLPVPDTTASREEEEEEVMQPQQPSFGTQAGVGEEHQTLDPSSTIPVNDNNENSTPIVPDLPSKNYIVQTDIEVIVDATVYPMGFRIVEKTPGIRGGKIATKFIFESIASRLGIHPEIMKLSSRSERIRFGETIDYEEEKPSGNGHIWVDVYFLEGKLPPHLQTLRSDDQLIRCVQLHARLDPVRPTDLVAARKRGLNYEEAIRSLQRSQKSENIVTIAILHEPRGIRMPFLGGYRAKNDHSRIFLHATTQLTSPGDTTLADLKYGPLPRDGISRKTQTYGVTRSCQTLREGMTQTSRPDYETDDKFDEIIIAKPYFSSIQLLKLQSEMSVIIQKMYRKWKARKIYRELAEARQSFLERAAAQATAEETEKRRIEEFERRRRATPQNADDFATLRRELEAWRAVEAARILSNNMLSEVDRRAALTDLTKKELQLLQELETVRRSALRNRRTQRFEDMLALMTSAKECGNVSVITPAAERARELRQLYLTLTETSSSIEARLDVLLHVKWTVKEFDSPLTRQIVELIDRESDLLNRGRSGTSLKGLRMRLENLFKRFIATPEYNPAVDDVVKGQVFGVPADGDAVSAASTTHRLKPSNAL